VRRRGNAVHEDAYGVEKASLPVVLTPSFPNLGLRFPVHWPQRDFLARRNRSMTADVTNTFTYGFDGFFTDQRAGLL
jgi:hypothetical protein